MTKFKRIKWILLAVFWVAACGVVPTQPGSGAVIETDTGSNPSTGSDQLKRFFADLDGMPGMNGTIVIEASGKPGSVPTLHGYLTVAGVESQPDSGQIVFPNGDEIGMGFVPEWGTGSAMLPSWDALERLAGAKFIATSEGMEGVITGELKPAIAVSHLESMALEESATRGTAGFAIAEEGNALLYSITVSGGGPAESIVLREDRPATNGSAVIAYDLSEGLNETGNHSQGLFILSEAQWERLLGGQTRYDVLWKVGGRSGDFWGGMFYATTSKIKTECAVPKKKFCVPDRRKVGNQWKLQCKFKVTKLKKDPDDDHEEPCSFGHKKWKRKCAIKSIGGRVSDPKLTCGAKKLATPIQKDCVPSGTDLPYEVPALHSKEVTR